MPSIEEVRRSAERMVQEALETKAAEVIGLLEVESVETRALMIAAITQRYHRCGEVKVQGYCPRCE